MDLVVITLPVEMREQTLEAVVAAAVITTQITKAAMAVLALL
jgi:hypothetical protein